MSLVSAMEIGSEILWHGRIYVLAGVDPMNVPGRLLYLRDRESGELVEVPYEQFDDSGSGGLRPAG